MALGPPRGLRAYKWGLRAYWRGLTAYQRGLTAYQRGLRPYLRGLRVYQRGLRACQMGLRASGGMYGHTYGCMEFLIILLDFVPYQGHCPKSQPLWV